jgi:hypothetical protein
MRYISSKIHRARKHHTCYKCGRDIYIGIRYINDTVVDVENKIKHLRSHLFCLPNKKGLLPNSEIILTMLYKQFKSILDRFLPPNKLT